MASNKNILNEVGIRLSKSRELSYDWRVRKPEKRDFGIEFCNVADLCRRRGAFENDKERKVRKMTPPVKYKSVPFGWEGVAMVVLMVAMLAYNFIWDTPSDIVLFVMTGMSVFIIAMYFRRKLNMDREYNRKKKEFEEEKLQMSRKQFPDEELYDAVVEYAKAVADYEAWEERRKTSFWKDAPQIEVRDSLFSIYAMFGSEPDDSYGAYVDFYADEEDGRKAIGCVGGRKVNLQFVESFVAEMKEEGFKKGVLYAFSNIENQAAKKIQAENIEVRNIDYVMELVRELEEM